MKKILFLLLLISSVSFAQGGKRIPNGGDAYDELRLKSDGNNLEWKQKGVASPLTYTASTNTYGIDTSIIATKSDISNNMGGVGVDSLLLPISDENPYGSGYIMYSPQVLFMGVGDNASSAVYELSNPRIVINKEGQNIALGSTEIYLEATDEVEIHGYNEVEIISDSGTVEIRGYNGVEITSDSGTVSITGKVAGIHAFDVCAITTDSLVSIEGVTVQLVGSDSLHLVSGHHANILADSGVSFNYSKPLLSFISNAVSIDFPSINSNSSYTYTVSVAQFTSVKKNDIITGSPINPNGGLVFSYSTPNADGTVWVTAHNSSGGAIDQAPTVFNLVATRFKYD
jgi:hypothetical protein